MTPPIRRSPTPVRTIVIVDHDVGFVGIVRERIRQAGYRPIWAPDAREALAAITHEKPAMLVIDIGVPWICGLELLAKLDRSSALARIPRVMLSRRGALAGRDSTPWPVSVKRIDLAVPDQPAAGERCWPQVAIPRSVVAGDRRSHWSRTR
jgi:hypothetical protein